MAQLVKMTHTIDEMLESMGVKIVLDGTGLSEEDRREAEKNGDIVKVAGEPARKDEEEDV